MAKKGMKRPNPKEYPGKQKQNLLKNDQPPVPEIQGKAKTGNEKAGRVH